MQGVLWGSEKSILSRHDALEGVWHVLERYGSTLWGFGEALEVQGVS